MAEKIDWVSIAPEPDAFGFMLGISACLMAVVLPLLKRGLITQGEIVGLLDKLEEGDPLWKTSAGQMEARYLRAIRVFRNSFPEDGKSPDWFKGVVDGGKNDE